MHKPALRTINKELFTMSTSARRSMYSRDVSNIVLYIIYIICTSVGWLHSDTKVAHIVLVYSSRYLVVNYQRPVSLLCSLRSWHRRRHNTRSASLTSPSPAQQAALLLWLLLLLLLLMLLLTAAGVSRVSLLSCDRRSSFCSRASSGFTCRCAARSSRSYDSRPHVSMTDTERLHIYK